MNLYITLACHISSHPDHTCSTLVYIIYNRNTDLPIKFFVLDAEFARKTHSPSTGYIVPCDGLRQVGVGNRRSVGGFNSKRGCSNRVSSRILDCEIAEPGYRSRCIWIGICFLRLTVGSLQRFLKRYRKSQRILLTWRIPY